ncbi:MAG: hypothetical protein AAFX06_30010, partial [Planctomycetota bacterium]
MSQSTMKCGCGAALAIKPELSGKQIRCPKCKAVLTVPALNPTPAPVATPVAPQVAPTQPAQPAPVTTVRCGCGQMLRVPPGAAGKQLRCPKCQQMVQVPGGATAPTVAPAPATPVASPMPGNDPFAGVGAPIPAPAGDNPFADLGAPAPTPAPAASGFPASPSPITGGNINPYAATVGASTPSAAGSNAAEILRNEHLQQEASIKTIGALYMIGGTIGCFFGVIGLFGALIGLAQGGPDALFLVFAVFLYAAFGGGFLAMGLGLRRFNGVARIAAIIMSWMAVPIGNPSTPMH